MPSFRPLFPCFKAKGFPKSFLDSAASAQKPACVLKGMERFAVNGYANIHRGVHSLAEGASVAYEQARARVAKFIGAPTAESIVFTQGTTAAVNLAAYALTHSSDKNTSAFLPPGSTILTTALEHHSNYLPWQRVAAELGTPLITLPFSPSGDADFVDLEMKLSSAQNRPALLAITQASNVLGVVPPLKKIIALAHKYGCWVFVDGAQAVAHFPVNVVDLDADFYAFSGHKLYGPTGIGALYIKPALVGRLAPWQLGGGMVHRVGSTFQETLWAPAPHRFEAGTPPIVEVIGLCAAIEFVEGIGFEKIMAHEAMLRQYLIARLREIPSLTIYGDGVGGNGNFGQLPVPPNSTARVGEAGAPARIGVVSFNLTDIHPHDVGSVLGACGVAVRVGHHCAQVLMNVLGIQGCVRVSLGVYNEKKDIDLLVDGLRLALKKLS